MSIKKQIGIVVVVTIILGTGLIWLFELAMRADPIYGGVVALVLLLVLAFLGTLHDEDD